MHEPTQTRPSGLRVRALIVVGLLIIAVVVGAALQHSRTGDGSLLRADASAAKLLVAGSAPATNEQVAFIGDRFTLNTAGCLQWGTSLVVALPGSTIAPDGKSVTLVDYDGRATTYPLNRVLSTTIGGSGLEAHSSLLPTTSSQCGPATHIALVQ